MFNKSKRMRARALAIGALVSTIASVGAVTDTASAAKPIPVTDDAQLEIVVEMPPVMMSMRSGVRW